MTAPTAAPPTSPTSWLADLPPNYFAMAMATGIVSLACHVTGFEVLAKVLFWVTVLCFAVLWVLLLTRLVRYPSRMAADLLNHGKCVGFFTIVAATCVLGSQCLIVEESPAVAVSLWVFGIALWVILNYTIVTALTIKENKPSLPDGINGGWLLIVVAAQSVAVLGAQLAAILKWTHGTALFFCLAVWLGGGMLYIWIISLIFYRYTFFRLSPSDLSPPYWINMGAVAISTLAGTMLVANASHSPMLADLLPFIKGFTLLFWATATWWIPMLVILGLWRHVYQKFPLRYDPQYWGVVFPLGMYTVATFRLVQHLNLPFLSPVPNVFVFVAVGAWGLAFLGLAGKLLRLGKPRSGSN
ncbi:MAG: tellurite resistance/C4-dicarboxylate transporter family protein [Phycisphaeraceae bacterium]|nr:tellurite resistance/C4-dicarboxylate transporter family protein [Phycisphaeraceae bacterium]